MYFSKSGLLIGFHGCEEAVRNEIVSGNSMLKVSENGYDWLGYGFYFWESNYERALDFACNPPGKKKFKVPSVLGAVIDLQLCLDLMDTAHIKLVKESYNVLQVSANTMGKDLPVNKGIGKSRDLLIRELDCAVIENLHYERGSAKKRPFDSTRGIFVEGDALYPNAGFHEKNHIQICVRNPNCIKGFFIPRNEVEWAG